MGGDIEKARKEAQTIYKEFVGILHELKREDSIRKSKNLIFRLLSKFKEYNTFIVANQLEDEFEYDSSVMYDFSEVLHDTIRYYWHPCLQCKDLLKYSNI